jgi:hypothetical protein
MADVDISVQESFIIWTSYNISAQCYRPLINCWVSSSWLQVVEPFTAHYVFALGVACFLSCAHWVVQVCRWLLFVEDLVALAFHHYWYSDSILRTFGWGSHGFVVHHENENGPVNVFIESCSKVHPLFEWAEGNQRLALSPSTSKSPALSRFVRTHYTRSCFYYVKRYDILVSLN